jgi:endonuclease/exonuclease/phosphatase family metal-dependent hydrolase
VGRGWDAAFNRTLTLVRLRDRRSGREFRVVNTHFDHAGEQARIESARLIARLSASPEARSPLVVLGDFNATRDSETYRVLAGALRDSALVSRSRPRGGEASFNDFGKGREPGKLIDFIFVSEGIDVLSHRILTKRYRGRYPSDHFPLLARIRMQPVP